MQVNHPHNAAFLQRLAEAITTHHLDYLQREAIFSVVSARWIKEAEENRKTLTAKKPMVKHTDPDPSIPVTTGVDQLKDQLQLTLVNAWNSDLFIENAGRKWILEYLENIPLTTKAIAIADPGRLREGIQQLVTTAWRNGAFSNEYGCQQLADMVNGILQSAFEQRGLVVDLTAPSTPSRTKKASDDEHHGLKIVKRMTLAVSDEASYLERALGHLLPPYAEGLYLPHSNEPVIDNKKSYLVLDPSGTPMPVAGNELCYRDASTPYGDIYRENGQLLVPHHTLHLLAATPYSPLRALKLLEKYAQQLVWNHFAFTKIKQEGFHRILDEQLVVKPTSDSEWDPIDSAFEHATAALDKYILEFMGEDHYATHYVILRGDVLIVEKSEDYRIHVFNQKYASGEWDV